MSDDGFIAMKDEFKHARESRQYLGSVYRDIKAKYGHDISISYMDPRNLLSIASYFIKHWRNKHISFMTCMRHIFVNVKFEAVFINGHYLENVDEFDRIIDKYIET